MSAFRGTRRYFLQADSTAWIVTTTKPGEPGTRANEVARIPNAGPDSEAQARAWCEGVTFRVVTVRYSNAPGLYGWDSSVKLYLTKAEALAAMRAPWEGRQYQRLVDEVHNDRIPAVGLEVARLNRPKRKSK